MENLLSKLFGIGLVLPVFFFRKLFKKEKNKLKNLIFENPKAVVTALIAIIIAALQMILPIRDFLTAEMQANLNIILYPILIYLIGRWTRINKSQATELEELEKDETRNQL